MESIKDLDMKWDLRQTPIKRAKTEFQAVDFSVKPSHLEELRMLIVQFNNLTQIDGDDDELGLLIRLYLLKPNQKRLEEIDELLLEVMFSQDGTPLSSFTKLCLHFRNREASRKFLLAKTETEFFYEIQLEISGPVFLAKEVENWYKKMPPHSSPRFLWISLKRSHKQSAIVPELESLDMLGGTYRLVGINTQWKSGSFKSLKLGSEGNWEMEDGETVSIASVILAYCKLSLVAVFENTTIQENEDTPPASLTPAEEKQLNEFLKRPSTPIKQIPFILRQEERLGLIEYTKVELLQLIKWNEELLPENQFKELYRIVCNQKVQRDVYGRNISVIGENGNIFIVEDDRKIVLCSSCLGKAKLDEQQGSIKCALHLSREYEIAIGNLRLTSGAVLPRYALLPLGTSLGTTKTQLKQHFRTSKEKISEILRIERFRESNAACASFAARQIMCFIAHKQLKNSHYPLKSIFNIKKLPWTGLDKQLLQKYLKMEMQTNGIGIIVKADPSITNSKELQQIQPEKKLLFKFSDFQGGLGIYAMNFYSKDGRQCSYFGKITSDNNVTHNHYLRRHPEHLRKLLEQEQCLLGKIAQTPFDKILLVLESSVQLASIIAAIFELKSSGNTFEVLNIKLETFDSVPPNSSLQEYLNIFLQRMFAHTLQLKAVKYI